MNNNAFKTVIVCTNCAWNIFNFRLSLITRLKNQGYRVIVITQYDGYEKKIKKYVDQIMPLSILRNGINPFIDAITLFELIKICSRIKPDYLLLFTIKPVIYGAIAAKFFKTKTIVMISGLGTAFITDNWITYLVKFLYKFSLSKVSRVFFQNKDDRDLFLNSKLVNFNICKLTPGSGINLDEFSLKPMIFSQKIIFILIARLIWDKGIHEYVKAAKIIKAKYPNVKFQLLGPLGAQNRRAISKKIIIDWVENGLIEYLGEKKDVRPYIEKASCVVLPSYREGTSRALLEAGSIGRPIIASDVPGCREIVENGITGFLCKSRDYYDLSKKMEVMINLSHEARKKMGIKGRRKIEKEFNQDIVNDIYLYTLEN